MPERMSEDMPDRMLEHTPGSQKISQNRMPERIDIEKVQNNGWWKQMEGENAGTSKSANLQRLAAIAAFVL